MHNKQKKSLNKKKISIYLVAYIFLLIICYIVAYCFYCILGNKGTFVFDINILTNRYVLIGFGVLVGIFTMAIAYYLAKYKFFNNVVIDKSDRINSDLYDNQSFMTKDEIIKNYGKYDFTELNKYDKASGYLLNSSIEYDNKKRPKLMTSLLNGCHAVVVGTTGTGKSTYLAGPIIQCNARSKEKPTLIINDISGELYRNHSLVLQQNGYEIKVINLHTPRKGLRFNPLSIVWDMYHEYINNKKTGVDNLELLDRVSIYINEIANFMCVSDSKNNYGLEWQQGAKGIVQATIWGMLEDSIVPELDFTKEMFTIAQLSNIINKQKGYLLDFLFKRNKNFSKTFDYAGNINDNASEKTVASYLATLSTSLSLFLENGMQYLTSTTDIDISHLDDKPTAIFIITPPEYPERYIISTMLYSQIYNSAVFEAKQNENGALKRSIYYILDEFGNLPRIKNFPTWIATSRKMKIFFFIMLQSNKQLNNIYGREEAQIILNNCEANMFIGSAEFEDIERFKKLFGTYTATTRNQSFDTEKDSLGSYKGSVSLVKKDLVTTSALQQIEKGTMYVYLLRQKPIKAHLVPIFDESAKNIFILGKEEAKHIEVKSFVNKLYDIALRDSIMEEMAQNLYKYEEEFEKDYDEFVEREETPIKRKNLNKNIDFIKK